MRWAWEKNACADREPLRLAPAFKDYLWGGQRLRREFGKETDMNPLAESWELSCHEAGLSVIGSGEYAGTTLRDYLAEHPDHSSETAQPDTEFPLLIKLIDAEQMLSVQVHPDDDYARRVENASGKTEMWYVVDAKPGAGIYYGFRETVTRSQMAEAIRSKTLTTMLNWVEAQKGDVFFIPAGTIHAIGAGLLVAEVQQNSNVTYRMWDYGRVGADGKTRELHIEKGLDVTVREHRGPTLPYEPDREVPGGTVRHLVRCERFCVDAIHLCGLIEDFAQKRSFVSLLCLEGEGALLYGEKAMPVKKGESIFIPAGMGKYKLAGMMQVLKTTL
ncbi:MAG: class I mannose-6-phosphate isomerase [Clostridia bacterium]|nr:class I mannose-6-phosphate isomerase [Clostridia bacterium]